MQLVILILVMMVKPFVLFDFQTADDLRNWYVVDDGVMGGRSQGILGLSEDGYARYEGKVSLENNGGFSSIRYRLKPLKVADFKQVVLKVRGDQKRYQFRAKPSAYDRQSYITYFDTTGEWQEIRIPMKDLYPTFRGRRLNMPNFPGQELSEIAFLIGNKKAEAFQLEIAQIRLE